MRLTSDYNTEVTQHRGEHSLAPLVGLLGGGQQEHHGVADLAGVQHGLDAVKVRRDDGHPLLKSGQYF